MLVRVDAPLSMSWSPELIAGLADVGRSMRPIREILGEGGPIFGFSDYRESGSYATSTLYLTVQPHLNNLVRRLEEVRASGSVQSHALEYKSRKSWARLWPSSLDQWLTAFRESPGLAVCVAYSRRLYDTEEYRALKRAATREFQRVGRRVTARGTAAALQKLLPFMIVAPLLQGGALGWASDRDSMLQGGIGEELLPMLLSHLDRAGANVSIVQPLYDGELPSEQEVALSLPDLVSGVIADLVPSPFVSTSIDVSTLDAEAFRLLAGLSLMGDPFQSAGPAGKLHVCVLDRSPEGCVQLPIALRAHGAPQIAPP